MTNSEVRSTTLSQTSDSQTLAEPYLPPKQVFLAWEKLRIVYILALAAVSFRFIDWTLERTYHMWPLLAALAIAANACYFAGPIGELYLTWIGLPRKIVRYGLFTVGTIFACFLAASSLDVWNLPLLNGMPIPRP
ncbi:MAG: hypothetical protein QM775_04185 [Pirellulales bacterium]